MSRDTGEGPVKRPRPLERARVGWPRPLQELKDLLYEAYLAAGAPSLNNIVEAIEGSKGLPGNPGRDTVRRCISEPALPPNQADVITVAVVLARGAAWSEKDLAARAGGLWVKARLATPAGRPIEEFNDQLILKDLEIHPALNTDAASDRFGALPAYVPRPFDAQLRVLVAGAAAGRSGVGVLVGGSSTGKTRACWEAVRRLPAGWRLWHPLDPSRPDAVLAELPHVAPRTVVWLNEAQDYLEPRDHGEKVAAGVRNLLHDPRRGPILILVTLWPGHWDTLTTRTAPDRHAQARELLDGHSIHVPDAFTDIDLAVLAEQVDLDPRLEEAAEQARDRQITQYLAGVPVLMDRYQATPGPITRALIHAAMDARRLGAGPRLPLDLLSDAAPGYLTEYEWEQCSAQWEQSSAHWLQQSLDYVMTPCRGIPGILTRVRVGPPRNRRPQRSISQSFNAGAGGQSGEEKLFRLADYLEQHGRRHRADQIPPIGFWASATKHAHPADLVTLGDAAQKRGLYRDAAQLYKRATTHGSLEAACSLIRRLHDLHPADLRPAQWAATQVSLTDPAAVTELVNSLREAEAHAQIAVLAERAATQVSLTDPAAVAELVNSLRMAKAHPQVTALAERAAAQTTLDNPTAVAELLNSLRWAKAQPQITALLDRNPAAQVSLDDPTAVAKLLDWLRRAEAHRQITALLDRNPAAQVTLDDPTAIAQLLYSLERVEARSQVAALAERAAAQVVLDNPSAVAHLLNCLRLAEAHLQVAVLAERAATETALVSPYDVADLLNRLQQAEAHTQIAKLLGRNPAAQVTVDNEPQWRTY